MKDKDINIKIKLRHKKAKMPCYSTQEAAGLDLYPCIDEPIVLKPNEKCLVPTGISICMGSKDLAGLILPRSGLSMHGIILGNQLGLIDPDYEGEIKVHLWNSGNTDFTISNELRMAQLLIIKILRVDLGADSKDVPKERGEGGFGHTGLK